MRAVGAQRVRAIQPGRGSPEASRVVHPGEAAGRIEWGTDGRAILAEGPTSGGGADAVRTRLVFGPALRRAADGVVTQEVLVGGWLVEVELEAEHRAALRDRARRATESRTRGGPTEVRAELPGRVASLLVAPGERVAGGQALVVIEAMKMLNEVRAPRAGLVDRLAVTVGGSVELGDLLVILR
jgi:biotin carboxyl carrier protein